MTVRHLGKIRFKLWHFILFTAALALYLWLSRYQGFIFLQFFLLIIALILTCNPISVFLFLECWRERARENQVDGLPGGGIRWLTTNDRELGQGVWWLDSETGKNSRQDLEDHGE